MSHIKKSISFLLGAGFSAPKGYPVGNQINEELLNFNKKNICFSGSGNLCFIDSAAYSQLQTNAGNNIHQKYFVFCQRLIAEYTKKHCGVFDYEVFYDFLKTDEAKEKCYQLLCRDLTNENECYDNYLFNTRHIYNQMVGSLIRDNNGKSWYDDEPFRLSSDEEYYGFLKYLSVLASKYIVNVHTLNHDVFFESFNNTKLINGKISDGFDEYGSEYYGDLIHENRHYRCRLERFTGRYPSPIRLYKLHGSIDYVPFYKSGKEGLMSVEKYVKIRWGIGAGDVMKARKSKFGYDVSWSEYHSDFLTGTTSKIQRYTEPLLFKKLFEEFKSNLKSAEKLIIIGYGCKDDGINRIIKENFDYKHKKSFIIDAYATRGSQVDMFKDEIHAQLLRVKIGNISKELFE